MEGTIFSNARLQRVAHRGGARLAPENTLAAFRNALTMPIDVIELDVQMSHDHHLIVFHDATVEHLTDGQGNILDLDFAYLRSLNAAAHFPGGWPTCEQIPTLREALALAKGRIKVYIEIKRSKKEGVYGRYPNIAEAVVREVRALKMLQEVLIISFDWDMLLLIRALEPALQTGVLVSSEIWDMHAENALAMLVKRARVLGVSWINMDYHLFTPMMRDELYRQGLKLGLWTINTTEEMQSLIRVGIDSLTTDRPDLFADL
ncbi:MAG: glycerophosphodiester phosphodiesterase [Chloroflexi bacterium]|nr:glycerophosphodiester phosphodiesterase [Ktedonobacteraceae bacterium]MBV8822633.1 glycerophosphodiester phosphodiesterase [Ktedonobacteraceae bacterium]MBV9020331.1 glycerophosphodiester phosphodiesterase [Ktedonobacteraceae bacterium]MBV9706945.1 glycerophosphodiester phosphodiesterase [Chloroflexota bacterium]